MKHKFQMPSLTRITLTLALPLSTLISIACQKQFLKENSTDNRAATLAAALSASDKQKVSGTIDQASGRLTAALSSSALVTQEVSANGDSNLAGVLLKFPPGSLAIDTNIALQESVPIATSSAAASLGLRGSVTAVGLPLAVQPSVLVDPAQPFIIALQLPPGAGLRLASGLDNLVVMYKANVYAKKQVLSGIFPRSALTIEGDSVRFTSRYFGAFQIAYTETLVEQAKEVETATPVQTKYEVAALPALSITSRSPYVVRAAETVTLTGKNFRPSMILSLGGQLVSQLRVLSDISASFIVPTAMAAGGLTLTAEQDGSSQSISLLFTPGASATPVITLAPVEVCAGLNYYDATGNLQVGIKPCAAPLADCAADGATGCVAVSAYKAADMTRVVAGNIKSSVTIAGVIGAYPSATYPLPSASAITDLSSLAATTAAGSYEWWGADGSRYAGTITDAGTITPTTINQTFNTSLYRQFTVAGDANLVASKIKSGVSLFGVTGDYPSATNPLAGADSTADLDLATFDAKIKSSADFEWFSSDGTRHQNAGDADITAANIANGVHIYGANGTLSGVGAIDPWNVRAGVTIGGVTGKLPVNCRNQGFSTAYTMGAPQAVTSIDLTSNQLTVPSHGYTANQMVRVNYTTAPSSLVYSTTYYVRSIDVDTIELASTTGGSAIDITASGANVTIYAYATGTLNTISSIDDYYNYTSSGYTYSNLWTSTNTCAGVEAIAGDSNVWKDVTTDTGSNASICSGTPANCTYQDKVSGLSWSKSPAQKDWANALLYCSSLTYNNQTGWRLPTQKELMNAYEHGMMTASNANWLTSTQMQSYFWSSSTYSTNTNLAWLVYPAYGTTYYTNKNLAYYVSCVR